MVELITAGHLHTIWDEGKLSWRIEDDLPVEGVLVTTEHANVGPLQESHWAEMALTRRYVKKNGVQCNQCGQVNSCWQPSAAHQKHFFCASCWNEWLKMSPDGRWEDHDPSAVEWKPQVPRKRQRSAKDADEEEIALGSSSLPSRVESWSTGALEPFSQSLDNPTQTTDNATADL